MFNFSDILPILKSIGSFVINIGIIFFILAISGTYMNKWSIKKKKDNLVDNNDIDMKENTDYSTFEEEWNINYIKIIAAIILIMLLFIYLDMKTTNTHNVKIRNQRYETSTGSYIDNMVNKK